jgi:ubiquinone/menaquinone biosynthesis C-methylase UbiE
MARFYDLLEYPMESGFSNWRKELLSQAEGKTLEVGIGTGKNIPHYPIGIELTGIDFSPKMIEIAGKKAQNYDNVSLHVMDAESMDFEDNSFDTVVTSCVFCSVPNPVQGLKEIRRVCKKDGKVLMLEHVRSNNKVIGKMMDIANPLPLHIYGANINRRTFQNLLKAGFEPENIQITNLWFDIVKRISIVNNKKKGV